MRDQGIWSISLGTWGGVRVRLHGLFLLFAAFTAYLAWLYQHPMASGGDQVARSADSALNWLTASSMVILYVSVLAHELGHVLTAYRLGGGATEIVLGPWGGLGEIQVRPDPRAELAVSAAGPAVNFLLAWGLCFPILIVHGVPIAQLLHPLAPEGLFPGGAVDAARVEWLTVVKLVFWINWVLVVVNLIPVFPFDGGNILCAGLLWLWPDLNRRWSAIVVTRFARLGSLLLLVAAWFSRGQELAGPVPAWFALVALAGLVFFSARQSESRLLSELAEPSPLGYDFSQGYLSADSADATDEASSAERWTQKRKNSQQRRQREIEAEDERRVDGVLARLHEVGLENLSDADRELLKRVSERYRLRQNRPS